ncbi:hypothetical protein ABRI18_003996 [Vibrio fluvialis]
MKKIAFYLGSDTLVYLVKPILQELFNSKGKQVLIVFPSITDERAKETFLELFPGNKSNISKIRKVFREKVDCIVCANDWGAEIKLIIKFARRKGIKTIGIQESIIDLSEGSDKYQYVDFVLAQGDISRRLLKRKNIIVTGNPRYQSVLKTENKFGEYALINCNFTYGVFEEHRDKWIYDVTSALQSNNVDFKISKHPRDFSKLEGLEGYIIPSGAGVIHDQIDKSKFLITRFSSLIHESILMGKAVIYYNPHGEKLGYDFTPDGRVLYLATSPQELDDAIFHLRNSNILDDEFERYIKPHLDYILDAKTPSKRIIDVLNSDLDVNADDCKEINITREFYIALKTVVYNKFFKNMGFFNV